MAAINSYDPSISISVTKAMNLYGVTAEDLKVLNANGDDKITVQELRAYGLEKNAGLTSYFDQKTSGALLATKNHTSNPFRGRIKDNFRTNYNAGQLTPRVDSDFAQSNVGNVLPLLYA